MNTSEIYIRACMFCLLLVVNLVLAPVQQVFAEDATPKPVVGPRLHPPASPHPSVNDNYQIFNELIVPYLPAQSHEADVFDEGKRQEAPGRGARQTETGIGSGITLYRAANVCNDFNQLSAWSSQSSKGDLWSDHYAGWGAFAVEDGWLHHADNVTFSLEQVIGPANKFGPNQYSLKIASYQPYAAGIGSPKLAVPPGSHVIVSVKYMIYDHDTLGADYDWVSLGLKPDAAGDQAIYVNGYKRGEWAELTRSMVAGESGEIMVLIQAQSPMALNSNIYFDDISISVNDKFLHNCAGTPIN